MATLNRKEVSMQYQNEDGTASEWVIKDKFNFSPECELPGTALTCLNSLKHGGSSRMMFIPGEQPQDFYKFLAESFENHKPATIEHSALVTDSVVARWFLWRRQRAHYKCEFEIFSAADQQDSPPPAGLRELALMDRYVAEGERKLSRALRNLQMVKKSVFDEEKWRTHLEREKLNFDLDLKKFELRQEQHQCKQRAEHAKQATQQAEVEAEANRFKPAAMVSHLTNKEGVMGIGQKAYVTADPQGLVSITLEPGNDIVASIIENRDQFMAYRPMFVQRTTYFTNGTVPKQYKWTLQHAPLSSPDTGVASTLSFESFRRLAADEQSRQQAA